VEDHLVRPGLVGAACDGQDADTIALYVAPGTPYKAGGVGTTPAGSHDLALEDERDLEDGVRAGLLSAAEAVGVRQEGERVIGLIEAGTPPFDPRWASWLPESDWEIPTLRPGWEVSAPPFGELG
jgi:hypothetical protein